MARTPVGGVARPASGSVTRALIGVNVAVFLLGMAVSGLDVRFGNLALAGDGTGAVIGVAHGQVYRLITAAFLHAGLLHIGTNMLALFSVGPALEAALGRVRYLALYLLAALGGSVLSFLVSPPTTVGVGASGAIFGLFGAYYVVVRRIGGDTGQIVGAIAINLVITFTIPLIDWRAHVGGLVTGAAVAALFVHSPAGPRRPLLQLGGCLAVALALAVAVAVRAAALNA